MSKRYLGTIPESNTPTDESMYYDSSDRDDLSSGNSYSEESIENTSISRTHGKDAISDSSEHSSEYEEDQLDMEGIPEIPLTKSSSLRNVDNLQQQMHIMPNLSSSSIKRRPLASGSISLTRMGRNESSTHTSQQSLKEQRSNQLFANSSYTRDNDNHYSTFNIPRFSPKGVDSPKTAYVNGSSYPIHTKQSVNLVDQEIEPSESSLPLSPDIPSPVAQNIDDLVDAEKRQNGQLTLSITEQREFYQNEEKYRQNEDTIYHLRSKTNQLFYDYCDMQKQQIEDLQFFERTEEEVLQNLKVEELAEVRNDFCEQFEKRQRDIINQIDETYEKPVRNMYDNTQAIVRNMNRSLVGKILFGIVWLMELTWNWLRTEWGRISTNLQRDSKISEVERPNTKRIARTVKKRKGTRRSEKKD